MQESLREQPWLRLAELLRQGRSGEIEAYLDSLPRGEIGRGLLRLDPEERAGVLDALTPEFAAHVLEQIPESEAADYLEEIDPVEAAAIVEELHSDERADILRDVEEPEAEAILARMSTPAAREARALVKYPDETAGGLMITEYLRYPQERNVADVVHDIRTHAEAYRDFDVQYAYVTGERDRLLGVLNLRQLLMASNQTAIKDLMIPDPVAVHDTAELDELRSLFDTHSFLATPVLDASGRLVGVVRAADVEQALRERGESDFRQSRGILGGDELRTMPIWSRARRRLSWLSVNIVLNVIAASVIACYQDTLHAVIALAVFLPIISDMSGCSGNQAVAVSIRELSLGLVRPGELVRVWLNEVGVGVLNGVILGVLIAILAWLWQGNAWLGLVVGGALALNTVVAVSIGGLVPLVLKRYRLDPALASGPILTTITDMCGFFLVLSFAAAALPRLVGH